MPPIEPNHIYNMDCVEGMRAMPAGIVDLVITDPPFAIEFGPQRSNYNRTHSRVLSGYREIKADEYLDFTLAWMAQVFRVLKESGSAFVFSGWNNLKDILIAADEIGFTTVNHIIWKYQFGVVCKRRFVTSHYHCLYLCKNDARQEPASGVRLTCGVCGSGATTPRGACASPDNGILYRELEAGASLCRLSPRGVGGPLCGL